MVLIILIINLCISISSIVFASYVLHTVQDLKAQLLQQQNSPINLPANRSNSSSGGVEQPPSFGAPPTGGRPIGFRLP